MAKRVPSHGWTKVEVTEKLALVEGDSSRNRARHAVDVKVIRQASGMTQQAFARTFGFTVGALRDWEQGRKRPERTARVLLRVIAEVPDAVARAAFRS